MPGHWQAELLVLIHFGFIAFTVGGGLLCLWRRWIAALHLPALLWGVYIEASGRICPLTPIENALRRQAGLDQYTDSFVEHYLLPIIYPTGLTREMQIGAALGLFVLNATIYAWVWHRRRFQG
jgi:hypothetical protein